MNDRLGYSCIRKDMKGYKMEFKEFIGNLFSALSAGANTEKFTRTIFEAILSEDGQDILDEYKGSTYKNFYNGNTSIARISSKINAYVEPMEFSEFIHSYPDASIEILCTIFKNEIPDIDTNNAGDKLAELFVSIITTAAKTKKKSGSKSTGTSSKIPPIILDPDIGIAPDLAEYQDGVLYLEGLQTNHSDDVNPFDRYLNTASSYFSTKKTLLYAEKPHPFYDLYVCNDIRYKKYRLTGTRDLKPEKTIHNATIEKLSVESKYIIIEGIGGIGKSMLLTHLFLSSAQDAKRTGIIPLFLSLKDYKDTTVSIVDFIWKSVKEFDPNITQKAVIDALQEKKLILLLDGLDEVQSSIRDSFDQDLEAFIKSYHGNMIVITSRPVYSFVAYSKFSIFDIEALTKKQALELVQKLEFWDEIAKSNFLTALDRHLYTSHYQFASNPLLLTIMLMTYSSFGEVPAKMHVFYSKAYETMARLHDASKGSFKRPLHTKLTPEEFAKYFSQFCARTYTDEVLEFTSLTFDSYMTKVLKGSYAEHQGVTPRDFLLDLTDNLCIMYCEGPKYYFIHRSFQEYFASVYFASGYDDKLQRVGNFFEKMQHRSYTDKTFDMLYDMIPEKIERYIFLPFLENLISDCSQKGNDEEYWEYLERIYPVLYHHEGNTGEMYSNEAESFLYQSIIKYLKLEAVSDLDDYGWPSDIYDLPTKTWVNAYSTFLDSDAFDKYPDPELIGEHLLDDTTLVPEDELPYQYENYFGEAEEAGITIEIEIYQLRRYPQRYSNLRNHMEQAEFPLLREYHDVKKYYEELKDQTQKENESDDLFDD